jgi:NAD(P)-dependent dehydrogenase (short-subunit alcohol dehydrogenase family)
MGLQGRHVIVIGGSTGIGRAVVDDVVAAGGIVTVGSRSIDKLDTVRAEHGDRVKINTVDVRHEDSVRAFFAAADPADHLVICPGDMAIGPVTDITQESIDGSLGTKIIGQVYCVRHALPRLADRGSIIMIAGAAGFRAYSGMPVTAAANAAIGGLAQSLALDLKPRRVNVIVAGLIDTPLWDFLPASDRQAMFDHVAAQTPIGRIGQPSDVSASVLHLMTNEFIDGAVLAVDGGALIA